MSEDLLPWWPLRCTLTFLVVPRGRTLESAWGYFLGALVKPQHTQLFWACPGIHLGGCDVPEANFQSEYIGVNTGHIS